MATALELYCTGSLNLFNHPTNVDLNSRVVCIVLKGLGENLRKIAMHTTNEFVTAAVNADDPLEGERILLELQFRRLDDMIGLHNFDEHALYGYAMKLRLLERQQGFRYEAGKRAFDGLMDHIRQQVVSL